jgi:PTH1 family peptidyl-tRNA hydrolase
VWAVVGLGNPGRRYTETRHNVGFLFIKNLARDWGVRVKKNAFLSKTAEMTRASEKVILAMPQTFMNSSGQAVRELVRGRRLPTERLIVVYDDVDIPLGDIRVRKDGGPGTHKGMASIVQEIATTRFPRIRVGIGPAADGGDIVRFVLSNFRKEEKKRLDMGLEKAEEALGLILADRIEAAMNKFN